MRTVRERYIHRVMQERLSCYLDGQLPRREAGLLEEHLRTCDRCATDLRNMRATVALLHAMPPAMMPRSVVIPQEAVAVQCRAQRVDTFYTALRGTALAVTLVLAVLLSGEALVGMGAVGGTLQSEDAGQVAMARDAEPGPTVAALEMAAPMQMGGGEGQAEKDITRTEGSAGIMAAQSDAVEAPEAEEVAPEEQIALAAAPQDQGAEPSGDAAAMGAPDAEVPAELSASSATRSEIVEGPRERGVWSAMRVAIVILGAALIVMIAGLTVLRQIRYSI